MSFCFTNNLVFVKRLHRSLHPNLPADGVPIHSHSVLQAARAWFGMRLCVNRFECETTSNIGHKWARDAALSESHSYKAQGVPLLHGRKETNYRALTAGSIACRAGWKLSSGEKLSARRRSPASLWSLEDTSDLTDLRALTWTTSLTTHSISSVSLTY